MITDHVSLEYAAMSLGSNAPFRLKSSTLSTAQEPDQAENDPDMFDLQAQILKQKTVLKNIKESKRKIFD